MHPARGFATVSVPSKVKPAESSDPASTVDSKSVSEIDRPTPAEPNQPVPSSNDGPSLQNYTPEQLEQHLEDAELQILIEKHATKCKSDAIRQAGKLETERRVLRQQAVPVNILEWLPSDVVGSILGLAEAEEQGLTPQAVRDKRAIPEDELCTKLWVLKDTLLKLGFPGNRVEEALKHVLAYFAGNFTITNRDIVCNLDESLEWLAMHCDPEELPSYTQINGQRKDVDKNVSWISDRESSGQSTPKSAAGNKAPRAKPLFKEAIPQHDPYDSDSSLDPDTLVPKYLDLQTRLYNLRPEIYDKPKKGKKGQSAGATVEDPQTLKLQRKISSIENDVLFDRKEAEHLWREKLGDLRKEAAIFRRAEADTEKEQVDQKVPEPEPEPEAAPILEDGEAGDLLGDMFQTEEEPTLELGVITEELNGCMVTSASN